MGNIALWKFSPCPPGKKKEGEDLWALQAPATVEGPVRKVEVSISCAQQLPYYVNDELRGRGCLAYCTMIKLNV
jgi:hypothetical protein